MAANVGVKGNGITLSVLVVDDDANLARVIRTLLRSEGYIVLTAGDGEEALGILSQQSVNAIVTDLRMPRMDGRQFYREVRSRGIETPVLIASAYSARSAQRELGANAAIEKPFEPEHLLAVVKGMLQPQSLT
jgi:two-component system response regulator AtoC